MSRSAFKPANRFAVIAATASLAFALSLTVSHQAMAACLRSDPPGPPVAQDAPTANDDVIICNNANQAPTGAVYDLLGGNDTLTVNENPLFSNGGFQRDDGIFYTLQDPGSPANNTQIVVVTGSTGNDIFNLNGGIYRGQMQGNDGNDIFNITGGAYRGAVLGGIGDEKFTINGGTFYGNVQGDAGNDTYLITNGTFVGTVQGNE